MEHLQDRGGDVVGRREWGRGAATASSRFFLLQLGIHWLLAAFCPDHLQAVLHQGEQCVLGCSIIEVSQYTNE